MTTMQQQFDAVVFAGGGCRCLWQVGFWEIVAPELNLCPDTVVGVSAGATMACMILTGKIESGLQCFVKRVGKNPKNFYPSRLFNGQPAFPQYGIYRATILDIIDPAGLQRLHNGPELRVVLARPPRWLGSIFASLAGIGAYHLEKRLVYPLHPVYAQKIGFVPQVVCVQDCQTPEALADLLLQSSCTPPVVPVLRRDKKPVLDGGLIDNVPVFALPEQSQNALILLTRPYPKEKIPHLPGRLYVQPSQPVPVKTWDYTSPEKAQRTFDIGRADGERFLERIQGGLAL